MTLSHLLKSGLVSLYLLHFRLSLLHNRLHRWGEPVLGYWDDTTLRQVQRALEGDADLVAHLQRLGARRGDPVLRALPHIAQPEARSWRLVYKALQDANDTALAAAEALLDAHWPDALRTLPEPQKPTTPARARLTRCLSLTISDHHMIGHCARILAHGPALPHITCLIVRGGHDAWGGWYGLGDALIHYIADCTRFPNLTTLHVDFQKLTAQGLPTLLTGAIFKPVCHLNLSRNPLGADGLQTLARSPQLAQLTTLELIYNQLDDDAIPYLTRSPFARNLRTLDLCYNATTHLAAVHIANSPNLKQLEVLRMERVGDEGAEAIATSQHLHHLTTLDIRPIGSRGVTALLAAPHVPWGAWTLRAQKIGCDGLEEIVASPRLLEIRELDLRGNGIADAGAMALAASPYAENIETLVLDSNRVGVPGLRALLASPHLKRLRTLSLNHNAIHMWGVYTPDVFEASVLPELSRLELRFAGRFTDVSAQNLVRSLPESLKYLDMSGTGLTSGVVCGLEEPGLSTLVLEHNEKIGNAAAYALSTWSHIQVLRLRGCRVRSMGARAFAESETLTRLRELDLYDNRVGPHGAEMLIRTENLPALSGVDLRNNSMRLMRWKMPDVLRELPGRRRVLR